MTVFAFVVERGSFSAAARALRLTPSAVSKLIARLEARLGVALIKRTTRALSLTTEGEAYHRDAARILAEVEEIERALAPGAAPRGVLRVTAVVPIGYRLLAPALPAFLDRYPEVRIDLMLTDRVIDLAAERADVAVRAGPLPDSGLKARKLIDCTWAVVAAPAYLAARGRPDTPAALADHDCLSFNFRRAEAEWPFRSPKGVRRFAVDGRATAGDGETLRALALAGVGVARLARFHVEEDLAAGRLEEILCPFNPGDREYVHAVIAPHSQATARVRVFLDFLVDLFARSPSAAA